jgi:hypothetical protein
MAMPEQKTSKQIHGTQRVRRWRGNKRARRVGDAVANFTDERADAALWMQGNAAIRDRWHTVARESAVYAPHLSFSGKILSTIVIAAWRQPAFCTGPGHAASTPED